MYPILYPKTHHMYKVNFYLKGAISDSNLLELKKVDSASYQIEINKAKPIIISVVKDNERIILSTGKKICQRFWNNDEKTIKLLKDAPSSAKELKQWLKVTRDKLETELDKKLIQNKRIDKEQLASLVSDKLPKDKIDTWQSAIESFLLHHKTSEGDSLKPNTIKKYKSVLMHIICFQKNNKYDFQNIDIDWINKFKCFLLKEQDLTDNTVCKYLKALKTFIKVTCKKKGVLLNVDFSDIKTVEKSPIVNILHLDELNAIKNYHFKNDEFNKVRDVFLFQCYTGQRYSDIEQISWDSLQKINESYIWVLDTVKTNDHISVPLIKEARLLIDKYKSQEYPLPKLTNQYINRELKKMGKEVGLDRKIKIIKYRNNVKEEVYQPLWQTLSSHIARKTFISISLQNGIPERAIREVSGHKDEKSFKRYIELDNSHHKHFSAVWDKLV